MKDLKKGIVVDREARYIGVYVPEEGKIYTGLPRKKVLNKTYLVLHFREKQF